MLTSLASIPSVIVGAAVFVILFVVLSVTLWVSILAGVAAFAATALISGATALGNRASDMRGHRV